MQIAPEADTNANMVGERHGFRMGGSENKIMGTKEPVEISSMNLGGPIGMQNATRSVPERREIRGFDIPIPTEDVRHTAETREGSLKSIEQLSAQGVRLRMHTMRSIH